MGRRLGQGPGRPGLQGAREHELRVRLHLGRPDGAATLDEVVEHAGALDRATSLPVSVDLENGYGRAAQDVARAVARVAGAGAVGASIEDYDAGEGIYPLEDAARAGRGGRRGRARPRLPVHPHRARREPHPRQPRPRRHHRPPAGLRAARAPTSSTPRACATREEIRAVCDAVSRPVNVLAHRGLTLSEIVDAGGQRISVGGALTWVGRRRRWSPRPSGSATTATSRPSPHRLSSASGCPPAVSSA